MGINNLREIVYSNGVDVKTGGVTIASNVNGIGWGEIPFMTDSVILMERDRFHEYILVSGQWVSNATVVFGDIYPDANVTFSANHNHTVVNIVDRVNVNVLNYKKVDGVWDLQPTNFVFDANTFTEFYLTPYINKGFCIGEPSGLSCIDLELDFYEVYYEIIVSNETNVCSRFGSDECCIDNFSTISCSNGAFNGNYIITPYMPPRKLIGSSRSMVVLGDSYHLILYPSSSPELIDASTAPVDLLSNVVMASTDDGQYAFGSGSTITEILVHTFSPTVSPTSAPTDTPTTSPTVNPTNTPTSSPTTANPTHSPSVSPTVFPSRSPTTPIPSYSPIMPYFYQIYPGTLAMPSWKTPEMLQQNYMCNREKGVVRISSTLDTPYCDEECLADPMCNYVIRDAFTKQCILMYSCETTTPSTTDYIYLWQKIKQLAQIPYFRSVNFECDETPSDLVYVKQFSNNMTIFENCSAFAYTTPLKQYNRFMAFNESLHCMVYEGTCDPSNPQSKPDSYLNSKNLYYYVLDNSVNTDQPTTPRPTKTPTSSPTTAEPTTQAPSKSPTALGNKGGGTTTTSSSSGAIVGGVVGGLAAISSGVGFVFYSRRTRRTPIPLEDF